MRLRSLNLLSLVVIITSTCVLVGVPGLRENLRATFTGWEYGAVSLPDAPRSEQEALVAQASLAHSPEGASAAYEEARQLAPRRPAPHLIFARSLVTDIPLRRTEVDALWQARWPDAGETQEPEALSLSGEDRRRIADAEAALDRAARLDPDNAAVDWLQAYLAIAQHQDDRARERLRAMLSKRAWTFYERDVIVAAYELVGRERSSREAATATVFYYPSWAWTRAFARVLTGMALTAKTRGDNQQAILLRESGMHAGRLMAEHGYTLVEALTGNAVWDMCAADTLSPAEKLEAEKQATLRRPSEGSPRDAPQAAIRKAEFAKFADYLRRHGRADLAGEVTAYATEKADRSRRLRDRTEPTFALFNKFFVLLDLLSRTLRAAVPLVGLVAAVGLVALLLRLLRRPVRSIGWPRVGWLLVYAISLGAAFTFVVVTQMNLEDRDWSRPDWEHAFCVIALPAVCALTLAVVLLHRRRHPESREVGPVRSYVGTLLAVLLPFAVLLGLLCLGLSLPTTFYGERWASVERAIVYQGGAGYYAGVNAQR